MPEKSDPSSSTRLAQRLSFSWDDLRAFLAVSVHGSMNRAAQELGESQPTVGRRMRRLEAQFGLSLFQRGPNNLSPTKAGMTLAETLRPIIDIEASVRSVVAAFGPGQESPIRLTCTNSLAIFLSENMDVLREAAAPLEVVLVPTRESVSLAHGQADLALRMREVKPEAGLLSRKVAVVAAAIYGRADRHGLPMIISPPSRMFSGYRELALREAEQRQKGPQIDELHLRLQAVRAGVGAGILPCWIGDADPVLKRLSERSDQFVREEMFLVRTKRSRENRHVAALAKALVALIQKNRHRLGGTQQPREGN